MTRKLKVYHRKATKPVIVTNMGGSTIHDFLPAGERARLYEKIEESLKQVNSDDVEIIPQTMPPFPWHFGGQSHHNLFVDPDEIVNFCVRNNMRICFDVSHSQLACNYYNWSMVDFTRKVAPYTAHIHVVDAEGIDGEGLQIGEGTMDFTLLCKELNKSCPEASFVPEIWQGHKNNGAGFWFALNKLETFMNLTP